MDTRRSANQSSSLPAAVQPTHLAEDVQARMKAFSQARRGLAPTASASADIPPLDTASPRVQAPDASVSPTTASPVVTAAAPVPSVPAVPLVPPKPVRSQPAPFQSLAMRQRPGPPTASSPKPGGLASKRGLKTQFKLSDAHGAGAPERPMPDVSNFGIQGGFRAAAVPGAPNPPGSQNPGADPALSEYNYDFVKNNVTFKDKAHIHDKGIDFVSGLSICMSADEIEHIEDLGSGNYGTVFKARYVHPDHRLPTNLQKIKLPNANANAKASQSPSAPDDSTDSPRTGTVMAVKKIFLEATDSKFQTIIRELEILHRCISPFIVQFFGAFLHESAVHICLEYMDGNSVEQMYEGGMPENIVRKVTLSTVMGLKYLKDAHQIIHRDVKPTNILINSRGQIKICDFGVSGQLVASIARTNIGCQSYMAPERISGKSSAEIPYSVQSDVWSLGLTIAECAVGRYPYPREVLTGILDHITAIISGDPPELPDHFSAEAKDFVRSCLSKDASQRPTYNRMPWHPWLKSLMEPPSDQSEVTPVVCPSLSSSPTERRRLSRSKQSSERAQAHEEVLEEENEDEEEEEGDGEEYEFDQVRRPSFSTRMSDSTNYSAIFSNPTTPTTPPESPGTDTTSPSDNPTRHRQSSCYDWPDTYDDEVAHWVYQVKRRREAARSISSSSASTTSSSAATGLTRSQSHSHSNNVSTGISRSSSSSSATVRWTKPGGPDPKPPAASTLCRSVSEAGPRPHIANGQVAKDGAKSKQKNRPALHSVALDAVPGNNNRKPEDLGGVF